MRKNVFVYAAAGLLALPLAATAQDLDTETIVDQFTTGNRGNATGTGGSFGASRADLTEFADNSGADITVSGGTSTAIRYINTYAGASPGDATNGESPVVGVATVGNADRSLLDETIAANTRPGAASASNVVTISDDGGINCLYFGQPDDSNYYVEVDAFLPDRSSITGEEILYVGIRAGRNTDTDNNSTVDNLDLLSGAYAVDRQPGYALAYSYQNRDLYSVQTFGAATTAAASDPDGGAGVWVEEIFDTELDVAAGWHTLRVEANGSRIVYSMDGTVLADVVDAGVTDGMACLCYRESAVASADEFAGQFDQLRAGPATISAPSNVNNWNLFN